MSITELPIDTTHIAIQVDYETQRHDCTDLDDFNPDECVPCADCNHAECRHPGRPFPEPIDTTGMTEIEIAQARKVEVYAIQAAMTASPCDVAGCYCTRMRCGDECNGCGGAGVVDDERTGRTFTCNACGGRGVTA